MSELTVPDGTRAWAHGSMPGVPRGTVVIVKHASPSGFANGLYWLDLGEPIRWSFGVSESTGYWAGRGEFTIEDAPTPPADECRAEGRGA